MNKLFCVTSYMEWCLLLFCIIENYVVVVVVVIVVCIAIKSLTRYFL